MREDSKKRFMWGIGCVVASVCIGVMVHMRSFLTQPCVNIYDWYGVLPQSVLEQFERETGIHVHYDVFDNSEMLEAKLLASNAGYDVVFPTVVPYAARQIAMGIYQRLDKSLLPNLGAISPVLDAPMQAVDPHQEFILPYYWGTTGIAYDADKLAQIVSPELLTSNALLFDPEVVRKIAPLGVSLLAEPVDVIPQVLSYLKRDRNSRDFDDLYAAAQHLTQICPHVRRFSSSRFVTDLVLGDICVAQAWSGEALKAIEDAKRVGKNIQYILPKEGAEIWIDAVAIPVGAPNLHNAHVFINFLLRPDVSAAITNHSRIATMVQASEGLIDPKIRANPLIFPDKKTQKRLFMQTPNPLCHADAYERVRARVWAHLKMGHAIERAYFYMLVSKQNVWNNTHTMTVG